MLSVRFSTNRSLEYIRSTNKFSHLQSSRHFSSTNSLKSYDYDLIVVGGGSGGLATAKEAVSFGKKVALLDFVTPSETRNTKWGLGGTCVNVGCIPKKLMHKASLLKEDAEDSVSYGWNAQPEKLKLNWEKLIENIQMHIKSLNFGYKSQLIDKNVKYFNEFGSFLDPHTIETVNAKGQTSKKTAETFLIAVGGRPVLPKFPGYEHTISSDDIFSLKEEPGKTLVVGASYVALECAGFLHGFGYDTTVMVRSIYLRGFDQQMANQVGKYMENLGVKFIKPAVPKAIEKLQDGKLKVSYKIQDEEKTEIFDTVLVATGRTASTTKLGLQNLGIKLGSNNKISADEADQTSVPNIYAIGDCVVGRPELTPTAIQAGRFLARRLYNNSKKLMNYNLVPTTVFTPLEYGTIGLSEEAAIEKFGEENLEIYHAYFQPLEHTLPHRPENQVYAKLICNKKDKERVVGFHILSPNAGEITQGFAVAMRVGATKEDFDDTVGIHPTIAEELTLLNITKRSGFSPKKTGC